MINFEINNLTRSRIDKKFLKKVAEKTTKELKLKKFDEISIVIVGDKKIKSLNKKYLKRNQVTDVLAFGYGEVFICLPQARKQAKELGHSIKKELAILLIHGILHLAGYDDKTKIGYNKMVKAQEKIFAKIKNKK